MKRKTTITSGNVKSGEKYQLALRAKGKKIEAFIDGQSVAVYKDDKPEYFGRIKLFSAWEKTAFDNLFIEKLPSDGTVNTLPYASVLIDNADDAVTYSGKWETKCNGSSNDW